MLELVLSHNAEEIFNKRFLDSSRRSWSTILNDSNFPLVISEGFQVFQIYPQRLFFLQPSYHTVRTVNGDFLKKVVILHNNLYGSRQRNLTGNGILDLRDVGKVSGVGDSKAAHAMSMPPFLQRTKAKIQVSRRTKYLLPKISTLHFVDVYHPLKDPRIIVDSWMKKKNHILQSASGRLWGPCNCSFRRSHSCSWCSARGVYRASMELAGGNKTSVSTQSIKIREHTEQR